MPAKDLKELVAWLKANPDKASQGTNGAGSVMHLGGVLLQKQTGTRFQFVPYRGAGAATQDLLAGNIDLYFGLPADLLPHARTGKIRIYAVAAPHRLPAAPDIPTTDEAGVAGLHVAAWFGLWAPKGAPADAIRAVNRAVGEALADPAVLRRLNDDLSLDVPPVRQLTPEALGAFQKAEIDQWWPIIKAANIRYE